MGTKLIIDTDIGTDIDDALAIVFALASPELDLEGLTIVDGDVEARARMAACRPMPSPRPASAPA